MTWRRSRSEPPPTENGRKLSPSTAPKILPCGVCTAAIRMVLRLPFRMSDDVPLGGQGASKDGGGVQGVPALSFRGASQRVRSKRGPMTGSASEPRIHNPSATDYGSVSYTHLTL